MTHRSSLPQLSRQLFITDAGIETDLIYHGGFSLPHFASFVLMEDDRGVEGLTEYYRRYIAIGRDFGVGVILDSPTWRANPDWGERLGYSLDQLESVNRRGVALVEQLRAEAGHAPVIVISGCIGPRGDAYWPAKLPTAEEAQEYHAVQITTLADTAADMVSALTITSAPEAVGIVRASYAAGIPVVISFTTETDGRLPSGQPLGEAIEQVDAETGGAAAYFMINCSHPTHFAGALAEGERWTVRIRGLRANASKKSHAELNASEELDEGNPIELAQSYRELALRMPSLTVLGGCCGTDHRHVRAICEAQRGETHNLT